MTTSDDVRSGPRVRYGMLTFALMGGAAAWLARLVANAALVALSCGLGSTWPLWVTSAVATAVAAGSLVVAWRWYRTTDEAEAGTLGWLCLLGAMLDVTAIAGILSETAPIAVLDVCGAVQS